MGVASLHMPTDGKREAEAFYTPKYLDIMRKTSTAERKTEGKIEQGCCTINSWGNRANRPFFVETGSVKDMELFALTAKKGCPTEEKWQRNPQISP